MAWTVAKIKKEMEKLSASKGDTFNIPVTINGRLTRTLGRCMYQWGPVRNGERTIIPDKIEMSRQLLETATEECIIGVIKHEWAHYYVTKITKENHGHDHVFKKLCDEIGTHCTTTTKVERTVEIQDKYETFCSCCGKKTGGFARTCQTVKYPNMYRTKCCNGKLVVKQNW